jgi:hypothetical protein
VSKKAETETLKEFLKDLSENQELNEKSKENFKEMLETIEAAEKDGIYLTYDVLRGYYETLKSLKKTQDDGINTIYT